MAKLAFMFALLLIKKYLFYCTIIKNPYFCQVLKTRKIMKKPFHIFNIIGWFIELVFLLL